jgi:RNA polymerase-interacting CarD/CdnL/TRCF family regulator
MPNGDDYRQQAAECIRLAQQLNDSIQKATLLHMAEIWRDLAAKSDDKNSPSARVS